MKPYWLLAIASLPLLAAANDISRVNGSIHVAADSPTDNVETVNGSIRLDDGVTARNVSTVNGSIEIGNRANVASLRTVNGAIKLGKGTTADSIQTENGRMKLDEGARVKGAVTAVNGSASLDKRAEIGGALTNVNGKINIDGGRVLGGIRTTSGDITIGPESEINGDIVIEKTNAEDLRSKARVPKVIIGPGAKVTGTLRAEHEIELYVSNRATIGQISGAKAITFAGDEP